MAPIVAIIFVLPKIKKKPKVFETSDYVPEKKEEPVVQQKPEIKETTVKEKSFDSEIQSYREFLEKRKEKMTMPTRIQPSADYEDMSESYSAMRRRMARNNKQEQNTNIHNLSSDVKAMLIAGILDRKF